MPAQLIDAEIVIPLARPTSLRRTHIEPGTLTALPAAGGDPLVEGADFAVDYDSGDVTPLRDFPRRTFFVFRFQHADPAAAVAAEQAAAEADAGAFRGEVDADPGGQRPSARARLQAIQDGADQLQARMTALEGAVAVIKARPLATVAAVAAAVRDLCDAHAAAAAGISQAATGIQAEARILDRMLPILRRLVGS